VLTNVIRGHTADNTLDLLAIAVISESRGGSLHVAPLCLLNRVMPIQIYRTCNPGNQY
jgi:hypothetical protein